MGPVALFFNHGRYAHLKCLALIVFFIMIFKILLTQVRDFFFIMHVLKICHFLFVFILRKVIIYMLFIQSSNNRRF